MSTTIRLSLFGLALSTASFALYAPTADAGRVKITSVDASSTEPGEEGVDYEPKNLHDGKQSTVWVEGEEGSGLGSWVEVHFDGQHTISEFQIWNGNWYTYDFWHRHNRAKDIEVEFSDGTKQTYTLTDEMAPERIKLTKPVKSSSLRVKIKGIYNGNTFNDTCLSELQVFDDSPNQDLAVNRYTSSSTYPADTDGSYDPKNMHDGLLDSMWCEGNKTGDGTNEWLRFDFGQSRSVSQLRLRNGNAYSFSYFMKSNHAKAATLTFSDGTTEDIVIKGSMMEQVISFPSRDTTSIKVVFTEVKVGKEFNDLCISEAVFLE